MRIMSLLLSVCMVLVGLCLRIYPAGSLQKISLLFSVLLSPALLLPFCFQEVTLPRAVKQQMAPGLCPVELCPGKLATFRKQSVCLPLRKKAKENEGRKKKKKKFNIS